jgi:hypothetical protein
MTIVADRPYFCGIQMHCYACQKDYNGWMIANCTLSMAAAYMRAMSCPNCGADSSDQAIRTKTAAPDA